MTEIHSLEAVEERQLLVAFADIAGFARYCQGKTDRAIFEAMDAYLELCGDIVVEAGGTLVKPIGDEVLAIFPEDGADRGVRGLLELKERAEAWLAARGFDGRLRIRAHFGPAACGPIGPRGGKRLDVYGHTVNTCALLPSHGFALSPQAFRALSADTRKLFKKHTPPVRYIPLGEPHRDP